MPSVRLTLPHHAYDIHIGPGALAQLGPWVRPLSRSPVAAVVADASVAEHHAPAALASLRDAGFRPVLLPLPLGEERKGLDTVRDIYAFLAQQRCERGTPVVALGGGVAGDAVGFAAATYLRGLPFVQCPTTLLAMVDASVGGKVGVNLPQGKNLVGAFHQPHLVVADVATLRTLPLRELRCGLAECVKHGVIRDPALFAWIEQNLPAVFALDPAALAELVRWNVRIKADVVMADEKEQGERAHLNFGHTFAHAIEAVCGYGHHAHGEAVSLGMVAAARLAESVGRCAPGLAARLVALLGRAGLPVAAADLPATAELMAAMRLDKKVAEGKLRLILPDRLGAVSIVPDVPDAAVAAAWETLREGERRT